MAWQLCMLIDRDELESIKFPVHLARQSKLFSCNVNPLLSSKEMCFKPNPHVNECTLSSSEPKIIHTGYFTVEIKCKILPTAKSSIRKWEIQPRHRHKCLPFTFLANSPAEFLWCCAHSGTEKARRVSWSFHSCHGHRAQQDCASLIQTRLWNQGAGPAPNHTSLMT